MNDSVTTIPLLKAWVCTMLFTVIVATYLVRAIHEYKAKLKPRESDILVFILMLTLCIIGIAHPWRPLPDGSMISVVFLIDILLLCGAAVYTNHPR